MNERSGLYEPNEYMGRGSDDASSERWDVSGWVEDDVRTRSRSRSRSVGLQTKIVRTEQRLMKAHLEEGL